MKKFILGSLAALATTGFAAEAKVFVPTEKLCISEEGIFVETQAGVQSLPLIGYDYETENFYYLEEETSAESKIEAGFNKIPPIAWPPGGWDSSNTSRHQRRW